MKLRIYESVYEIIYDYTSEEGYEENNNVEQFEGTWTDLQDYIKQMRRNGCYNISANEISYYESVRRSKNVLRESDDKITARSFQELISKLEDHGYSCGHYYDMNYPESNWLYIDKNGDQYEAEFYRYSDGRYELYLHNIHPTKRRNESVKSIKERIFPDQYQSNIDGKTYTIRWHDDKGQFYVQIPCARKTLWSDDPEDLMSKIDTELKKCYKNESLHWGLYPNESEEAAEEDAYTIYEQEDIYSFKDIKRFLEGHSDTYISLVMAYLDELDNRMYESKFNRLNEQDVEIEVKHEGILEVPEGKNVEDLPLSHFEKLAKKKGLGKITKALNNLQVWNKNDDKKLSKWAGDMIDKLSKKLGKNESVSRKRSMKESGMYDYYDTPDNEYGMFTRNDMPTEEDYWYADLTSKMRGIVHEMEELGWEGIGFTTYGRDYGLYQHDKNRPELVYEMFVTIYEGEDSVSLSKYIDIYDEDKDKEISSIPNTSGVSAFRTEDDVRKFTKWFKRLGTSFSTNESKHRR